MNIYLTPAEIKLLDTFTRLDLEAIGFSARDVRVARGLRAKLPERVTEERETPVSRPIPHEIGFKVLRLTPTFRHEDK